MKVFYAVLILALLLGSFLIGSWYNQQKVLNSKAPEVKAQPHESEDAADDQAPGDISSMPRGTIKITPQKQQMIGVRVGEVERASQKYTLRTLGKVAADENRTYRLVASAEGWVSDVRESTTGSLVKKDQLMAKVYNYQFLTREQQYLYALEFEERRQRARSQASNPQSPEAPSPTVQQTKEQQHGASQETMPSGTYSMIPATPGGEANMSGRAVYSIRDQLEVAKLELYSLGVGDYQIQEIARTKKLTPDIEIRSPVTGIVLSRNVSPQQRFDRGLEFYRIADLTHVWIIADVYGGEEKYIKPGMSAKVSLPDEEKVFRATVTDVPPPFDTTSRTLKVRLEMDNPGNVLRPDMFVDVEFLITFPPAITVAADAVLDSGLKKVVFVDLGNGLFEPREVKTGWRFGQWVEIAKGLKPGERIAMSGTFLIDSESRLELAAAGMNETLSKDLVCGTDVSRNRAEKAGRKSTYQGKTYYFTSDECKGKFDKNPEHYVKKP